MAVDVKQYYQGLLKDAGVADDKLQALMTVLDDEKVAKKLLDDSIAPRLRHDDYARNMDALAADKKKNSDWYAEELKKYQEYEAKKTEYEAKLAALGTTDDDAARRATLVATPADMITKKQFDEELAKREQQTLGLLKIGLNLVGRHYKDFQEPLDTEALSKVAIEKGISLQQAYDEFTAPKRAEIAQKQREEELKKAREEGAREFASKHHTPYDEKPKEPHLIFDKSKAAEDIAKMPQPLREKAIRDAFVESWNAGTGTSGG